MVFWFGIIPVVVAIHKAAGLELRAMANPRDYWAMAAVLCAAAFAARKIANGRADRGGPVVQFEETSEEEVLGLGLSGYSAL